MSDKSWSETMISLCQLDRSVRDWTDEESPSPIMINSYDLSPSEVVIRYMYHSRSPKMIF